ncbi:hypothetical protein [Haloparvum sedimenti]|uniref:hypothetical protein n=1 Tax=Haloparvum sedimenti TaxID=1678448 RepID=UPI00071E8451|nr:hypothetical protein [Haloparvum sedimenti]
MSDPGGPSLRDRIGGRRVEKLLGVGFVLSGVAAFVAPFALLRGLSSAWVLGLFLGGGFLILLGGLFLSERTPVGDGARFVG